MSLKGIQEHFDVPNLLLSSQGRVQEMKMAITHYLITLSISYSFSSHAQKGFAQDEFLLSTSMEV